MQQDPFAPPAGDVSPDSQDRIRDFLARHRGPGAPRRDAMDPSGTGGWYEILAADGYRLRCDWSRFGSHQELRFSEIAPDTGGGPDQRREESV